MPGANFAGMRLEVLEELPPVEGGFTVEALPASLGIVELLLLLRVLSRALRGDRPRCVAFVVIIVQTRTYAFVFPTLAP